MADNTTLNSMSGGDVIAADDIGGIKHQYIKVEYGIPDSATPVSYTNPLPITTISGANNNFTTRDKLASVSSFAVTLASLASSTAGVGRQSTLIDNTTNLYRSALISLKITTGTSPTINTPIYVYLIRSDNNGTPIIDDGGGASDAGITIVNAPLLGTIINNSSSSNQSFYGIFDTKPLGSLGPKWGIAIVNSTGAALNATGGNHVVSYIGITQAAS